MAADVSADPVASDLKPERPPRREVIYRHTFIVRLSHWINAAVIFLMIGSGLNIFNAHPRLYWGQAGDEGDHAFLSIGAEMVHGAVRGVTRIGSLRLDTTGLLGWSQSQGHWMNRAWPAWITVPSFQDLADARHWHLLLAWILVGDGAVYLAWSLAIRHLQRDLWPSWTDLKSLPSSIWDHVRFRHPAGEAAKRYNVLQKLAYLGLILLVVGMVATGLTLSPGMNAIAPWLLDLCGGRQSARTLHFIFTSLITLFIVVHVLEVILAGPINEIRSMITGRYTLPREHD